MIYQGVKRPHGWTIRESDDDGRQWRTNMRYGPYENQQACMAMVYKLRRKDKDTPDNLSAFGYGIKTILPGGTMSIDTSNLTEDQLERLWEMSGKYMEYYSIEESDRLAYEQIMGLQPEEKCDSE